ncbi:acyltransferase [Edwardsiella tarda]|uniref:acyltransferase family protein n=1 Tax=Edwardsiella tarda TaxID=636 RepID=UPI00244432BE|nr:acyltransferase [Edwardsiella tarda]WGE27944.1 acyltransferase [Edwardsiella tarda]
MYNELIMILWASFVTLIITILMSSPLFSFIDRIDKRPLNHLDSLRALLAILVVFHHFFFNYFYSKTGEWVIDGYYFFTFIGKFAVGIFFILSGYLFSTITINKLSWWVSFYKKRILRIVPMTIISSLACIAISYLYGTQANESIYNIVKWFDGGLFNERPSLFGLNNGNIINAGVTWSLTWEWRLYLAIPLISLVIPLNKRAIIGIAIAILASMLFVHTKIKHPEQGTIIYLAIFFFSVGFFCMHLNSETIKKLQSSKIVQGTMVLALFTMPFMGEISTYIYPIFASILFLMICNGSTIFGLLKSKGLKRLGVISYSIYLLHGIFWYIGFKTIISDKNMMILSTLVFILMIFSCVLISFVIEYPIYKLSKFSLKSKKQKIQII